MAGADQSERPTAGQDGALSRPMHGAASGERWPLLRVRSADQSILGVLLGQVVDMAGGEPGHMRGVGLGGTELHPPDGHRLDPAQAVHPLEVDPAHAQPVGGLLRPERCFTGQGLREVSASAELGDLGRVELRVLMVAAQVEQRAERDDDRTGATLLRPGTTRRRGVRRPRVRGGLWRRR